jgi:FKBP12-rapamycin complex-associated protein
VGVYAVPAQGYDTYSDVIVCVVGELRQEASLSQELIRTDVLAEDHADEPAYMGMYEQSVPRSLESNEQQGRDAEENRATPNSEDYYPRVAVAALIKVLRDPNLTVHHSTATHTIIQIFRGLGVQCLPFLEMIVPYFLQVQLLLIMWVYVPFVERQR